MSWQGDVLGILEIALPLKRGGRDYIAVRENLSFVGGRGAVCWKVMEQRLKEVDRTGMVHRLGQATLTGHQTVTL